MNAFKATFSDLKVIKTRKCVQIIFEVPTEQFDAAYEVLGGLPNPAAERWFGIAAIKSPEASPGASDPAPAQVSEPRPERAKRDWRDLPASQQAALRCNEPTFWAFMREEQGMVCVTTEGAANAVRALCYVQSRADLDTNHKARVLWHQIDSHYQTWLAKERVA